MPSRRPHLKSRHGCVPCKRARVKCDQVHPICSKCVRFGRPCEYLLLPSGDRRTKLASSKAQSSSGTLFDRNASSDLHHASKSASGITFEDLGLMHLYTVATCTTLEPSPELREMWQVSAPKEAASHPFLMHCLLAMAALHQISLGTEDHERYLTLAVKHHNRALAGSKPELEHISERNCHALFVFSAMIAASALALPVCRNLATLEDPVREIAQVAILMRGSNTIVQTGFQWLQNGKFRPLLHHVFLSESDTEPKDVNPVLDKLKTEFEQAAVSKKNLMAYLNAFDRLKLCFRNINLSGESNRVSVRPRDRGVVWSWLATVEVDFIALISSKDSMALVLLAHYAVLMLALDEFWWCRGWGSALIKSISRFVGDDWQQSLSWPTRQISLSEEHLD